MLPFLPKKAGESVKLTRTASIKYRFKNYEQSTFLLRNNPLFGIGYNNICLIKKQLFGDTSYKSHSCSGADSSFLFLGSTTGILGIVTFIYLLIHSIKAVAIKHWGIIYITSLGAVVVSSFFINSFFYPWVLGWLGIVFALALNESFRKA
jgi:hypothetical protein